MKHERITLSAMGPGYIPVGCSCGWHAHACDKAEADEKFSIHLELADA